MAGCLAVACALVFGVYTLTDDDQDPGSPLGSGKMFDAIAQRYDIINTVLSLGMHVGWRERMIQALELKAGVCEIMPRCRLTSSANFISLPCAESNDRS